MQSQKVMFTYVTKTDILIYFSICYNSPPFILQYENYSSKRSSPPNSPLAVTSLATAEYLSLFVGQNKTKYDGAYDRESSTKENSASSPLGGDGKEIRQLIKVNKISLSFLLLISRNKIIQFISKNSNYRNWKSEITN